MLRKRRINAADGLTFTEVITVSGDSATADALREFLPTGLAGIELFWRPHLPRVGAKVAHQSFAWYAREILLWLERARRDLASHDPRCLDTLAYSALHVGWLHGTAFFRFNLGDQTRRGVKTLTHLRTISRKKRERRLGSCDPTIVRAAAERLRHKHPYSRERSTRWLAQRIAVEYAFSVGTVRRRLKDLKYR